MGALGTTAIAAELFVPNLSIRTTFANVIALATAGLMTFGFFHTSRLLRQRRKAGATIAGLCFIGPMVGYATGTMASLAALILSGLGLTQVASVWRHLD